MAQLTSRTPSEPDDGSATAHIPNESGSAYPPTTFHKREIRGRHSGARPAVDGDGCRAGRSRIPLAHTGGLGLSASFHASDGRSSTFAVLAARETHLHRTCPPPAVGSAAASMVCLELGTATLRGAAWRRRGDVPALAGPTPSSSDQLLPAASASPCRLRSIMPSSSGADGHTKQPVVPTTRSERCCPCPPASVAELQGELRWRPPRSVSRAPSGGGARVGHVGAVGAGADGPAEVLAELGMVLSDPGDRLADGAGHTGSSPFGRGRGSSISTAQADGA